MQYLHDDQYYIDRYDLHTIKECFDYYWAIKNGLTKNRSKFKDLTDEEFEQEVHKCASYAINLIKIQSFRYKTETLQEWMNRDRQMQELQNYSSPPKGIYCSECNTPTKVTFKNIENSYEPNARMMFMFACIKCNKHQAFYEDGIEWQYKPNPCPKCNSPLNYDSKDIKDISITTYSCLNCSYKEKSTYNFKEVREKQEKEEEKGKKLLAEYRKEFCYDEKTGAEAVSNLDNIIRFAKEWEEIQKKKKDPIYQKAKQLKRITVAQLKELLIKTIENDGYKDLQFDKPEMGHYVIIPFSVLEINHNRKEYDTIKILQKLIRTALEDTNWRLMSDGILYRLGYVYGRLKGYETEEDFMKLVQKTNKTPNDNPIMFDNEGEPIY